MERLDADVQIAAAARSELIAAQNALKAAEERVFKAMSSQPVYHLYVECSPECCGPHVHGSWCYTARVYYGPISNRVQTYSSRIEAENAAKDINEKRTLAWQGFLKP